MKKEIMDNQKTELEQLNPQSCQTDVICSALQDIWDFVENKEYDFLDGKMINFANEIQFKIETKINEIRNGAVE